MATGAIGTAIAPWRDLLGMRLVAGSGRPGERHGFFQAAAHDMMAF
jgi:catechol 2,3-dioxygenase-like lactoylglutathione lyase family enzyme